MPRLVLFDIDGTLCLTGRAGGRAMTRALRDAFDVSDGFAGIPMNGRTDQIILEDALARAACGAPADRVANFRAQYVEYLRVEIEKPGEGLKGMMPGVRELLDTLSAQSDVYLALLTGNYSDSARVKLEYFDLWRYFRCGAFADDAKDRNELVPVAVRRARACGVPDMAPAEVVVVGDTPLDIACAAAGGATSVAVATGGYSVEELKASGADAVLEDLSDQAAFLELLMSAPALRHVRQAGLT